MLLGKVIAAGLGIMLVVWLVVGAFRQVHYGEAAVVATGASTPADMGKLMAVVKPQLAGKADMTEVSKLVKSRLGN